MLEHRLLSLGFGCELDCGDFVSLVEAEGFYVVFFEEVVEDFFGDTLLEAVDVNDFHFFGVVLVGLHFNNNNNNYSIINTGIRKCFIW